MSTITDSTSPKVVAPPEPDAGSMLQRRTLRLLFATQTLGGIGVGIGVSVGALLATEMAGVAVSGLAQSSAVVGGALIAVPATRITARYGRRPSLAATYLLAAIGGATVVMAAVLDLVPLLFLGLFFFGGGTAAGLQARYTAVDLAPAALRGRHLSLIVWATTIGAVAGPNLAPLAGVALEGRGVPTLAGPFFFSALIFGVAAILLLLLLRPDPLLVARGEILADPAVRRRGVAGDGRDFPPAAAADFDPAEGGLELDPGSAPGPSTGLGGPGGRTMALKDDRTPRASTGSPGMRAALAAVTASPAATLGITATAVGHVVMIGVMAMTPVHILEAGYDPGHTLRIVGIVLSFHIAGMFALAPLTGWLSDRFGRRPVILGGVALLVLSCAIAGTAGHDTTRLAIGLTVLGLGWSGTMVAGSTLLSESVSTEIRPSAQGLSDVTMGLAGATAGAISGVVMEGGGYPTVAVLAAIATIPLVLMVVRNGGGRRPERASA